MSDYEEDLEALQIALVRWQQGAIESGQRVVVIFEGRDAAGKDGVIKRLTERLSARATRAVSLPKPSDRERTQWFFQRYVAHLPAAGELVLFNRSWYNRAGVEKVMGFSTEAEQAQFLIDAPIFEAMLIASGIQLIKIWLDIDKDEQARRLEDRRTNPLKALKVSPLDAVAQEKWAAYSEARDEMLRRTHTTTSPWVCVDANHKKPGRLAVIRHILHKVAPAEILEAVDPPDLDVLFPFEIDALTEGRLAR